MVKLVVLVHMTQHTLRVNGEAKRYFIRQLIVTSSSQRAKSQAGAPWGTRPRHSMPNLAIFVKRYRASAEPGSLSESRLASRCQPSRRIKMRRLLWQPAPRPFDKMSVPPYYIAQVTPMASADPFFVCVHSTAQWKSSLSDGFADGCRVAPAIPNKRDVVVCWVSCFSAQASG